MTIRRSTQRRTPPNRSKINKLLLNNILPSQIQQRSLIRRHGLLIAEGLSSLELLLLVNGEEGAFFVGDVVVAVAAGVAVVASAKVEASGFFVFFLFSSWGSAEVHNGVSYMVIVMVVSYVYVYVRFSVLV